MLCHVPTPRDSHSGHTAVPAVIVRKLSDDEAGFVAAAATLILPEPLHAGIEVDVVEFLNGLIASEFDHGDDVATNQILVESGYEAADVLDQYRRGVSAVQRYCEVVHQMLFQEMPVREKHLVLSLLEDGCSEVGFQGHDGLFRLLVLHASEAYFANTQILLRGRKR